MNSLWALNHDYLASYHVTFLNVATWQLAFLSVTLTVMNSSHYWTWTTIVDGTF